MTEQDWSFLNQGIALSSGMQPPVGWTKQVNMWLQGIKLGAEKASELMLEKDKRPDPMLSQFILAMAADWQQIFKQPAPHSQRSKFVKLVEAVAPIVDTMWEDRSLARLVRRELTGK